MEIGKNVINCKCLAMPLLLCLSVFICYIPVFSNGFLDSWDDQWMVMNVFTESGFRLENLIAVFTQSYKGQYSPLVELNYMVLYGLFGYDPFWFHLSSVVWHCGSVLLLFALIHRLLEMSGQAESRTNVRVAALTSFLFAIHPVNVESVAWISAVKVPMYVFFYLSALLQYLRYVGSQKLGCYIMALCCFVCSGLSKEQAFVLPLSLLSFPVLPGSSGIPVRFYFYPILVVGLLGVLYSCRNNRLLMFGVLFFVVHLLLSLHIVAMPRLGIVADRYLYLSLPGILLLVSYIIVTWVERRNIVFCKYLLLLSVFIYGLYFMGYTHHYSKQWKDTDTVKHYLRSFYKGENEEKDITSRETHD